MIPSQIITALFTATVGGAITRFMQIPQAGAIYWFILIYIIIYRTKQVLDDLVYYQNMKSFGTKNGEPFLAFCTWVLWVVAAFSITSPPFFFLFMFIIAILGVPWVAQAGSNVSDLQDAQFTGDVKKKDIVDAHRRWMVANFFVLGGCFAFLAIGWTQGFDPDTNRLLWIGPSILGISLLVDVYTDWDFMFKLSS